MILSHALRAVQKAAGVVSIAYKSYAVSTTSSVTAPSGIVAGDLLVLVDGALNSSGFPTAVNPTGFTNVINSTALTTRRVMVSYKIADGTESSTSITGMNGTSLDDKMLTVYSTNGAVYAEAFDPDFENTNAIPTSQTITSSNGTTPVIAIAASRSANYPSELAMSPTADGVIQDAAVNMATAYKIYNSGSTSDVVASTGDGGNNNQLMSFYLNVTDVPPPPASPTLTYITNSTIVISTSTYTFNLSGTYDTGLYVIGIISERGANAGRTLNTVTFNGNSMTSAVNTAAATNAGGTLIGAIFQYNSSFSVTNPSVVVTFSGTMTRTNIGVWRINNNNSNTVYDTATNNVLGPATSITNTVNSLGEDYLGVSILGNADFATTSWTNATERYEAFVSGTHGSGSDFTTTSSGDRTITATSTTSSGTGALVLVTAVWN